MTGALKYKTLHHVSIHVPGQPCSWATGIPKELITTTVRRGATKYTPASIPLVIRALRRIARGLIITVY